jgi:hypothetical protein
MKNKISPLDEGIQAFKPKRTRKTNILLNYQILKWGCKKVRIYNQTTKH